MIKIISIIGARPQFVKASMISKEIKKHKTLTEIILHTGQHFDENMSDIFFRQLNLPIPKYRLNINNLTHGAMVGEMLKGIEKILLKEKPDIVLVYGDTNSTLAGALAAKKIGIRVAHVEAGLRSYDMNMPEEVNRILTDRISDILFCPTTNSVENLKKEGFLKMKCKIIKSGDVMKEAAFYYMRYAKVPKIKLPKKFALVTVHRCENVDNITKLKSILKALNEISENIDVLMLVHPRTMKGIAKHHLKTRFNLNQPVGYLELMYILKKCSLVMTDSGGLQKEAFFFKKPCLTLREKTEWVELTERGANILVGTNSKDILESYKTIMNRIIDFRDDIYGAKNISQTIVKELLK